MRGLKILGFFEETERVFPIKNDRPLTITFAKQNMPIFNNSLKFTISEPFKYYVTQKSTFLYPSLLTYIKPLRKVYTRGI